MCRCIRIRVYANEEYRPYREPACSTRLGQTARHIGCFLSVDILPEVGFFGSLPLEMAITQHFHIQIDAVGNPFHILDEIFLHKSSNKSCADGSLSCA